MDQRSKGRKDKQTDVATEEERWRPGESGWKEGVTGRGKKRNRKKGKKRGRLERQKEKAELIFTDSQRFLNILLLPAV